MFGLEYGAHCAWVGFIMEHGSRLCLEYNEKTFEHFKSRLHLVCPVRWDGFRPAWHCRSSHLTSIGKLTLFRAICRATKGGAKQ